MKCLILAAGYATRLYPLTENFPKPLLKVGEKTILDWLVEDLAPTVEEFVVISNHKFAHHFEQWAAGRGERITVVDDGTSTNETRLGAVCDIKFAIDSLGIDDEMVVIAGDNVLDFSLTKFVRYALGKRTSCIMRYHEPSDERLHKCGVVEIDSNDLILSMEEKPANPKSHWCCPPFYFYTREDARKIGEGIDSGCGTDAPGSFIAWLSSVSPVHAFEMPGHRFDIGNLESYRKVCGEYRGINKRATTPDMKILITGAKGFVGKNLCAQLNNIKTGKAWYYRDVAIEEVYEYDVDSSPEQLDEWCREADFVFNLAGVNRPQDPKEFMEGNFGFATTLLNTLRKYGNDCPVMISSSIQATLAGRFGNSEYGKSKKAGEELMFQYGRETGAKVLVYRFPNLYGKWCRPNYNSAVATFCHNIANGLPITVNDPTVELELLYIDDLVEEMICALKGQEHHCEFDGVETVMKPDGRYCAATVTHHVTLGEIVDLLHQFAEMPDTLMIPEIPAGSFAKRLYSTYLSYLPKEKAIFDLKMNCDARGSFTELVHTLNCGQVSINISKPGITKGQHWHHSKWEQFIVVAGHGLIQMRPENPRPDQIGPDGKVEIREYEVSGDKIQSVIMLPGYTHNIINLSDTEDLVTVMYCNEIFNPGHPDTFGDPV